MINASKTMIRSQTLFSSSDVQVSIVRCPGIDSVRPESVQAPRFVVSYRGLFVKHAEGGRTVADPNHLMLFSPEKSYRVTHPVRGGDGCLSITVGADHAKNHSSPPARAARQPFSGGILSLSSRDQLTIHALWADLCRGRGMESDIARRVAQWVAAVLRRRAPREEISEPSARVVERVKVLLMTDLAAKWTLAELGEAVGRSPAYLTQLFRRAEGEPLHRYHIRLRLAVALERLPACTDLTGLALDVGFSHHSHFSATFRAHFGVTPSAFRAHAAPPPAI